jgi:RimJ/RimL family protein N-acetyltransferase
LFDILSDREVVRYIGDGMPYTRAKVDEFLRWAETYERDNGFCRWKLVERETGEIIGSCGFANPHSTPEIELGYLLKQSVWGRGLATEAARASVEHGFRTLGFDEIIAMTAPENGPSRKVLEKLGFALRGVEKVNGDATLVFHLDHTNFLC